VKDSDSLESLRAVNDFSELTRVGDGITQKMLTQQLREMESDDIVHGKVYAKVPPKVKYSVTALGASLKPVVAAMCKWGAARMRG
jgi:DNA-binding HxlR family transcriptional regulator